MSDKKLYIVTVKYEYAVVAEDEFEAVAAADDAERDAFLQEQCSCQEATMEHYLPSGWNDSCLVYDDTDGDLPISEAKELYVTKKRDHNPYWKNCKEGMHVVSASGIDLFGIAVCEWCEKEFKVKEDKGD